MTSIDKGGGNVGRYEHRQKQTDRERNSDWSEGILQNEGVNRHRQVARSGEPSLAHAHDECPEGQKGPVRNRQLFHAGMVLFSETCTRMGMTELGGY